MSYVKLRTVCFGVNVLIKDQCITYPQTPPRKWARVYPAKFLISSNDFSIMHFQAETWNHFVTQRQISPCRGNLLNQLLTISGLAKLTICI